MTTVIDHKYISENCNEKGCQYLVLERALDLACYDMASEIRPDLELGNLELEKLADELKENYLINQSPFPRKDSK